MCYITTNLNGSSGFDGLDECNGKLTKTCDSAYFFVNFAEEDVAFDASSYGGLQISYTGQTVKLGIEYLEGDVKNTLYFDPIPPNTVYFFDFARVPTEFLNKLKAVVLVDFGAGEYTIDKILLVEPFKKTIKTTLLRTTILNLSTTLFNKPSLSLPSTTSMSSTTPAAAITTSTVTSTQAPPPTTSTTSTTSTAAQETSNVMPPQNSRPEEIPPPPVDGTFNLSQPSAANSGFVTRQGNQLYLNGKPFNFISYNIPNYFYVEDKPGQKGNFLYTSVYEQEDACLAIVGSGGQAFRTFTLGVGQGKNIQGQNSFSEEAFVVMDRGLAMAEKYGLKVIIPFLNNQADGFGSIKAFGDLYGGSLFTSQQARDGFKNVLSFILNRRNTVTGKLYKDDPTILAWQLGNEYGSWTDPTPPADWTLEMAGFIKSIDSNHLVMDGTLAGHDKNRWAPATLDSPLVDIFYNHYYWGESDLTSGRISSDIDYIHSKQKAFIIGEFGLSNVGLYTQIVKIAMDKKIAGALIWSMRFHADTGGFYVHTEYDGHKSYHVPGFPYQSGFNDVDEIETVKLMQTNGWRAMGQSVPKLIPVPPFLFQQNGLSFRGSAWASSYELQRLDNGNWVKAQDIVDDKETPFSVQVPAGKYRLIAIGSGGRSAPSNELDI